MAEYKDSPSSFKDKDNAAYQKRREQVRRAQRTHRERKEAYIKTLENEVLLLRTNETRTMQEMRVLRTEIDRLRHIMDQHCIQYKPTSNYDIPVASSEGNVAQNPVTIVASQDFQGHNLLDSCSQFRPSDLSDCESSYAGTDPRSPHWPLPLSMDRSHSRPASSVGGSSWEQGTFASSVENTTSSAPSIELNDNELTVDYSLNPYSPNPHNMQHRLSPDQTRFRYSTPASYTYQYCPQTVASTPASSPSNWTSADLGLETLFSLTPEPHTISPPGVQDLRVSYSRDVTETPSENEFWSAEFT